MGDEYTIADIASFPWIRNLIGFYEAGDLVGIENFPNVKRVLAAFVARPAVERGLNIPKRVDVFRFPEAAPMPPLFVFDALINKQSRDNKKLCSSHCYKNKNAEMIGLTSRLPK